MLPFIDLQAQQVQIRSRLDKAIARVLDHGQYIMGPEVERLEQELAQFCGCKHVITCSSGMDALLLCLMAKKVSHGDAVFVPSFTFAATAEAVANVGATPIFLDCDPISYTIDPTKLEEGIALAKREGLRPVGMIPVDLFGHPAEYNTLACIAKAYGLWILADAAQSFGATYHQKRIGGLGMPEVEMTITSFFPSKPLGCYGDGGAIFTEDDDLAVVLKSHRIHGQGTHKNEHVRLGLTARLDTLQAAVLLEKLRIFPEEIQARQEAAIRYHQSLKWLVTCPTVLEHCTSVWAQYTICLAESHVLSRTDCMNRLQERNIPSAIYYPTPLHLQPAYRHYPVVGALVVSERLAKEVLSLPMSAYVREHMDYILETLIPLLERPSL
jgi:dTDP-4-amino-4,6-dideoxygalactose transaminase